MALKRNRIIFLLLLCMHVSVSWGQYGEYQDTTTVVYGIPPEDNVSTGGYDSKYYFDDSAQEQYNHSNCGGGLDKSEWEKRAAKLSFEKEKKKKKEKKTKTEDGAAPVGANLSGMKYIFIALAALIILFILYKIWPSISQR